MNNEQTKIYYVITFRWSESGTKLITEERKRNAAVFIDFLMAMAYNIGEQRNLID